MKILDLLAMLICFIIFFAVFGAFFDVITAKEAVMVLAVGSIPLTMLKKSHF